MRSRVLARKSTLATVGVEPFSGVDGQGAPSYDAPQNISARATRTNEMVVAPDGSDVRVTLKLWVPGDETPLPDEKDRLTHDGDTFIVLSTSEGTRLDGSLDHLKVEARDE